MDLVLLLLLLCLFLCLFSVLFSAKSKIDILSALSLFFLSHKLDLFILSLIFSCFVMVFVLLFFGLSGLSSTKPENADEPKKLLILSTLFNSLFCIFLVSFVFLGFLLFFVFVFVFSLSLQHRHYLHQ